MATAEHGGGALRRRLAVLRMKAWTTILHWRPTTLVLTVVLLVAACGDGTDAQQAAEVGEVPSESIEPGALAGTGAEGQPSRGGGAPIGAAPGQAARPAPINIPALEQAGNPPSDIAAALEPGIAEQCGDGSLCVTLTYYDQHGVQIQPSEPRFSAEGPGDPEVCAFERLKSGVDVPRQVDRNGTVNLFFECRVSDAGEADSGTGTSGAGVGSETDDTPPPAAEATSQSTSDDETSLGTAVP